MVVGSSVSIFLRNLLLFAGGAVMLVVTSPRLTGLVALVIPLVLAPILIYGRRVRRLSRLAQDRVADVSTHVDETLWAVRTVQAFNREGQERRRFAGRVEDAFRSAVARIRARAMLSSAVILLVFGAISLILWVGGHDVIAGRMTGGELSAFVFYALVTASAVAALSEVVGEIQRAAGATERLFDLMDEPADIAAPAEPVALPAPGGAPWRSRRDVPLIPRARPGGAGGLLRCRWRRASRGAVWSDRRAPQTSRGWSTSCWR